MMSAQYGEYGRQYIPPVPLSPDQHFLMFEVVGAAVRGEERQLRPWRLPTSINPKYAIWRYPRRDRRKRRMEMVA
jgi:hypothetical protein